MAKDINENRDKFILKIQKMFPGKYARVLQNMYSPPPKVIRINTHKIEIATALKELKKEGFNIKKGPLENSYIVKSTPEDQKISESQLFEEGKIYIQSLSSMLPVLMLNPKENQKILDMCAAPGSKTSQIGMMTKNNAEVVAVDNNKNRVYRLKSNLKRQGFDHFEIINTNVVTLPKKRKDFINYFDKVLLDAPCSNEGLIYLNDPSTYDHWSPKLPKRLSKLQKKLIHSGVSMVRPGGTFVYSTCTFSKEENEDNVVWLLKKYKQMSLIEVKKVIPDGLFTGFFAAKFVKLVK